ncbi:MAG: DUF167 domain-containing protein [Deltaproteobacteria bacterium]|nr:DUF167 domain-containing protein [Deltaproteobacteria bacterium]
MGRNSWRSNQVKVSTPLQNNAANKACQKFLAEFFEVPKSCIELISGDKSRVKHFLIRRPNRELVLNLIESLA